MSTAQEVATRLARPGDKVKSFGGNYLVRCPAHADDSPSLSICDGDGGLKVHCFVGCLPRDIYAAIRHKGLKLDSNNVAPEPAKGSGEYERRQHDKAAWLWSRRRPITNTPAERYLRERRRITCPLPQTLAYLPPRKPEYHPAMIGAFALVDEPEPGVVGMPSSVGSVHLTFLRADGTDKADVEKPKKAKIIVGSPGTLPIMLAPPNDLLALAITEGIEDALALHQALGIGALAAGAACFMPELRVPDHLECVTIEMHPDNGRRFAEELANKLHRRGVEVIPREALA